MNSEKGAILMITLWIVAILTLLTVSLAYRARMEIRLSSTNSKRTIAREMARERIELIVRILQNDKNTYDALKEEWALSCAKAPISCSIVDEDRKINLNNFPREVISTIPGMEETASAIIDWRDKDDVPLPGGAENLYYVSLNPPYRCKNKLSETMEELLAVKGVTPAILRSIKPVATVYGSGRLNINTAPQEVLEMLLSGLDYPVSLKDKIIFHRQGLDGTEGTADDNIFEATITIKKTLSPYGLTPEENASIDNLIKNGLIGVASSCYRINLKAVYEG